MNLYLIIVVGVIFLAGIWWSRTYGGFMPEPYRSRPCQGANWLRTFPAQSKSEIRQFLRIFVESFAFRESQKLQISPTDKVYEVYRAIYPKLGGIDLLELESFAANVERRYGVKFGDLWSVDLTFGGLFSECVGTD